MKASCGLIVCQALATKSMYESASDSDSSSAWRSCLAARKAARTSMSLTDTPTPPELQFLALQTPDVVERVHIPAREALGLGIRLRNAQLALGRPVLRLHLLATAGQAHAATAGGAWPASSMRC